MTRKKTSGSAAATPLMRQYRSIKENYPDCLLFFRLGDFYELFYEDAVVAARELDLVLTTRDRDRPDPVPMCGIPWFAAEGYIQKLVSRGYKVAICEQMEDPSKARGLVRREVVRVITPGTYVGPDQAPTPVVLAAIVRYRSRFGFGWFDVMRGEGAATEFEPHRFRQVLQDLWPRVRASEVLYPESGYESELRLLVTGVEPEPARTPLPDWVFEARYTREILLNLLEVETLEAFGLESRPAAAIALGAVLHYLQETQQVRPGHVRNVRFVQADEHMVLDAATIRNLELLRNAVDGSLQGTLRWTLDRTRTPMGRRLLEHWILNPLNDVNTINARLDAIEAFYHSPTFLEKLRELLKGFPDLERIGSRLSLGSAGPRDLAALREGLQRLPALWDLLRSSESRGILNPIVAHDDLATDISDLLERALVDDPPAVIREGGFIREGFHEELDAYRRIARDSKKVLAEMEERERHRTGIPNLKIRYNRVFGYYIEVRKTHLDKIPSDYERRQTLTQSERFVTPELKAFEEKILSAEERAFELEQAVFREILDTVRGNLRRLQTLAEFIAVIDVVQSLADTALRRRYRRPEIVTDPVIDIEGGRHPVIEAIQFDRPFIPNDTHMTADESQIHVITGPNMGGKSTYLRQVALICLMAQMGSFVPAERAVIGMVDRIFTRVGASDYLTRAQSTFMVEMLETAYILRHTTSRSLIILDEIGRGTSTFDGMAIAWAVLEYLHAMGPPGPRTLFATHFHELVHLADLYPRIRNYSVAVKESGDEVVFLYRVIPGPCDRSYGVHVAQLAGMPREVIDRARAVLQQLAHLEDTLEKTIGRMSEGPRTPASGMAAQKAVRRQISHLVQRSLFEADPLLQRALEWINELKALDLEMWSPVQAWQYLYDLQQKIRAMEGQGDSES